MRTAKWVLWLAVLPGCFLAQVMPLPFKAQMGESAGALGWYALSLEALPATKDTFLRLGAQTDCAQLRGLMGEGGAPVWVLVHGIGGMGPEWNDVQAELIHQPMRA